MVDPPKSTGTAQSDLGGSLYRAILSGLAGWQVVVIAGFFMSDTTLSAWLLAAVHGGIGLLALVARRITPCAAVTGIAALAAVPLDLQACRSVMDPAAFTTIWTMNLMILGPVGAVRGWWGTVIGVATSAYAAVVFRAFQPDWTVLHGTMITTGVAMVVAATVLTRYLYRFAGASDAEAANAVLAHYALSVARTAGREAADVARTMHDTAINTLAAVASGGAGTSDVQLVRDRCARDVETLERLLAGQRATSERTDLATIGADVAGIGVVRRGLSTVDLDRLDDDIPSDVLRALRSAADEAVRNAALHSGADQVTVTVRHGRGLVVEVADSGKGFDGRVAKGRGLSESVMARAADVGAEATVRSTIGQGTTVTLRWRPGVVREPDVPTANPSRLADDLQRWACWAWAAGVVGVGFVIEYAPRPGQFTATYVALTIVAFAALISWWMTRSRSGHDLPVWWAWALVALVPVTFTLGYEGVKDVPYLWQALSSTPLLVILLVHRRRTLMWAAVAALGITAVVLATVVADGELSRFGLIVVGAAPQIGFFIGWLGFYRIVGEVAGQSDAARRETAASQAELAAQQAVLAARARWQEAGAERALSVLRELAEGGSDPQDPHIRHLCADEERALRQIMQLSPEAVYLGPWLARALSEARERGVELALRTGDIDAPGAAAADLLGRIVVDRVAAEPPGARMTVGLFAGDNGGGRLLVVGSADVQVPPVPDAWRMRRQRLIDQELTEIVWPLDMSAARATIR